MTIEAKLIIDDTCNQDVIEYVEEILSEAFGKEEMKEYPRVKLILMDIRYVR